MTRFTVAGCVLMTDAEIGALSTRDLIEVYNLMAPFASKEPVERFPTRPIGVIWTCEVARHLRRFRTADGLRPINIRDAADEAIRHPTAKMARRGNGKRTIILDDPRFLEGGIDPHKIAVEAMRPPSTRKISSQEQKVIEAELFLAEQDANLRHPDSFTSRCRDLIVAGFDDETIWLTLQQRFGLPDDKRRWQVEWNRNQMEKES